MRDPVEFVAVAIPLLAEAVAVTFTIAVAILLAGIWSGAI
jgi:predicted anti-sigma-YlaC factor YlaD